MIAPVPVWQYGVRNDLDGPAAPENAMTGRGSGRRFRIRRPSARDDSPKSASSPTLNDMVLYHSET